MACLKCGKEVSAGQVFCDECLLDMDKYPVKPGTPVLLPNRPAAPVVHKHRLHKRQRKPEEQVSVLKNWLTFLCVFCCALAAALTLSVMLNLQLMGNKNINILPGQNYNSSEAANTSPVSTTGPAAADPTGTTVDSTIDATAGSTGVTQP